MPRELKNIVVKFISLVEKPATGKTLTLKDADGCAAVFDIVKTDAALKRAYGIVYAPDQEDSQGDFATANEIRKAADNFMAEGRSKNVDTHHNFEKTDAYVAESWLVRKGDPLFAAEPEGAWAVGIQVTSDRLWRGLEKGELSGISLAGMAQTSPAQKEEAPGWLPKILEKLTPTKKELPMDEIKELQKQVTELAAKMDALTASLQKAAKKDETPADDAPADDALVSKADLAAAIKAGQDATWKDVTKALADIIAKGAAESANPEKKKPIESEMV
jgi:hypothetical protein